MKRFASLLLALMLMPLGALAAPADRAAAAGKALSALENALTEASTRVYVYRDFSDTENHYTQKAKIAGFDDSLVSDMDESCSLSPHSGGSCIKCQQITRPGDWGGWLFLNGALPAQGYEPVLNDGSEGGQGLDLTGAKELRFYAKGERGGEQVEFFTCGFGYDGEWNVRVVPYPDSTIKRSTGFVTLSDSWQEFCIDLADADTSYVVCGFGYVLSGEKSGLSETVFYLDDIRFTGDFSASALHPMLRSYVTEQPYIKNAAFSYDNALAAMALLSAGKTDEAAILLDSFDYAIRHDRFRAGRVRNAYAAGDISAFPGWDNAARMPGWYDNAAAQWYEDRYQVGCNVGNTSYVALAMLQYDARTGGSRYLSAAAALMDWVIDQCSTSCGFTAGYDGWPEAGDQNTYVFTYKSIEHNIDAYAAFRRLYDVTGSVRYRDAAENALAFIRSMYDPDLRVFRTGTQNDGVTPSADNIVLDAQVWACLALSDLFAPYEACLQTVAAMRVADGGYPFCAANANGGWWAEGTAYTALMHKLRGEEEAADSAFAQLESIQLPDGLFPAATSDHLSTGIDLFDGSPWEYGTEAHIAPTAWYVMAVNGFNPYTFD